MASEHRCRDGPADEVCSAHLPDHRGRKSHGAAYHSSVGGPTGEVQDDGHGPGRPSAPLRQALDRVRARQGHQMLWVREAKGIASANQGPVGQTYARRKLRHRASSPGPVESLTRDPTRLRVGTRFNVVDQTARPIWLYRSQDRESKHVEVLFRLVRQRACEVAFDGSQPSRARMPGPQGAYQRVRRQRSEEQAGGACGERVARKVSVAGIDDCRRPRIASAEPAQFAPGPCEEGRSDDSGGRALRKHGPKRPLQGLASVEGKQRRSPRPGGGQEQFPLGLGRRCSRGAPA